MNGNKEGILKTFMSPVCCRYPANPQKRGSSQICELRDNGEPRFLLDELLGGGIFIPQSVLKNLKVPMTTNGTGTNDVRPELEDQWASRGQPGLFLLLVGPPGSGKSTFALEMCYRLACNGNPGMGTIGDCGISSAYFSAEATTENVIQQAAAFGWKEGPNNLNNPKPMLTFEESSEHREFAHIFVCGKEKAVQDNALAFDPKVFFEGISDSWKTIADATPQRHNVVVLDSLNLFQKYSQADELLSEVVARHLNGVLLTIVVLDVHRDPGLYDRWEHFADLVIHLSYEIIEDYLVRKMHIVKARYQDHADGEHRLKINPIPSSERVEVHPMSPFIKAGGIFVFPSVHRYLSVARRSQTDKSKSRFKDPIPSPFADLNKIIQGGGFPSSCCTAIVGSRGGMKSHLAYYTLLKFLHDHDEERALIISLRDPVDAAKETLAQIIAKQKDESGNELFRGLTSVSKAKHKLDDYLNKDRLEILFFWPGYISPEEFFHLVGVAIDRAPDEKCVSLVVVNGLEQLSARFPLCAKEKMFVSGLVTMFCVKGTTNIIVSGGDLRLPPDLGGVPAGLMQMADLIIESSFRLIPKHRIWSDAVWTNEDMWGTVLRDKQYQPVAGSPDQEPHVIYQIIREPGARECRRRALFYMGREGDSSPINEGSVTVKLLPDDFPHGERL